MKKQAFTLVEIIIWILITSIVIIWWFQAFTSLFIWKISLMEKAKIQSDSFYFSTKLYDLIKKWWLIDYEEYFNRKVVWLSFSWWHYLNQTWFWNFWSGWVLWTSNYWNWFYYCVSSWATFGSWWCYSNNNISSTDITSWILDQDYNWIPQRYGQYSFQFIDYNYNSDADRWDEDGDWNIKLDTDDLYIWTWPSAFSWSSDVKELYLLSWDKKTRNLFRWYVYPDPDMPTTATCNIDSSNVITWSGCIWTVEYLKLDWVDWWMDHNQSVIDLDNTQYDWVVDTWLIAKEFSWENNTSTGVVAWSSDFNYWKPLFPDTINVTDFKVYAYPNNDYNYNWILDAIDDKVSNYVTISYWIKPSWKVRKNLKGDFEEIKFNTTINLTDIYSN